MNIVPFFLFILLQVVPFRLCAQLTLAEQYAIDSVTQLINLKEICVKPSDYNKEIAKLCTENNKQALFAHGVRVLRCNDSRGWNYIVKASQPTIFTDGSIYVLCDAIRFRLLYSCYKSGEYPILWYYLDRNSKAFHDSFCYNQNILSFLLKDNC